MNCSDRDDNSQQKQGQDEQQQWEAAQLHSEYNLAFGSFDNDFFKHVASQESKNG